MRPVDGSNIKLLIFPGMHVIPTPIALQLGDQYSGGHKNTKAMSMSMLLLLSTLNK